MSKVAEHRVANKLEARAYATNWEHLSDELRFLDLCLHREVLKQRREQRVEDPLAPFSGLVISEAEIDGILTSGTNTESNSLDSSTATQQDLNESVTRLQAEIEERRAASLKAGIYLALPQLARLFHLTRFEEKCVLLCLAPELDRKYEKLYAYIQDDATRKKPTVDLLFDLLCDNTPEKLAARTVFAPQSPLVKYRVCEVIENSQDGPLPLLSRSLRLDDRIVSLLLGFGQLDARLDSFVKLPAQRADGSDSIANVETYRRTCDLVQSYFRKPPLDRRNLIFHFYGPAGTGKQSLAEAVAREIGLTLLIVEVERMLSGQASFAEIMWLLGREALLQPAALFLENMDSLLNEADKHQSQLKSLLEAVATFSGLTFMASTRAWQPPRQLHQQRFVSVEFKLPDAGTGKLLWEEQLRVCPSLADDVETGALASRFRFGPSMVRDALHAAEDLAYWRSPEDGRITMADLFQACRTQGSPKLGALARKIEPNYTWPEIVLPEDQLAQLKELCSQAKCRHIVYGDWGFDRKLSLGKGLNALFSGPPGTGKTMAAEVIANELQLDLYKIDLSQVVSKYIGETEKNLHSIFQEAQASNAILFFDEADALFGKRSEVKDAHDRYANIEVGYLLQKMEEYEGITILATNLRGHLDEAFVRRMHFIVEFPFPDEDYRQRIWEVTFPDEAPLGSDVDFKILAREVKLAGGNIKNIGLAAAFYAAANGQVIRMPNLMQAAVREYQKLGRTWTETDWSAAGGPPS
jgi:SpoVK/Ycf46/Vps4 family AAA+-type ATPase